MAYAFASARCRLGQTRRGLAITLMVAALGCQGRPAAAEEDAKAELFSLTPTLETTEGGQGRARLTIAAASGYKWNKEFPFKLVIDEQVGAALAKATFTRADARVADDGKTATVDLGAAGALTPGARLKGKANFSVCDAKVCKVYRNREVVWTLPGGGADGQP